MGLGQIKTRHDSAHQSTKGVYTNEVTWSVEIMSVILHGPSRHHKEAEYSGSTIKCRTDFAAQRVYSGALLLGKVYIS